jgi:hypothetical protein
MSTLTIAPYAVHNPQIVPFAKRKGEHYTRADLQAILSLLGDKGTLNLRRLVNGAGPAVTPDVREIDELKNRRSGENLLYFWLRDNALQCWGERLTANSPLLSQFAPLEMQDQWKAGAEAFLTHYRDNAWRFKRVVLGETSPEHWNANEHPPVVLDLDLHEVPRTWGHIQHDAHGLFSGFLFDRLNDPSFSGYEEFRKLAIPYIVMLHAYHWKLQVWAHWDLGCWERHPVAQHWSSICPLAVSFANQVAYLRANGHDLTYTLEGHEYRLHISGVEQLLGKCTEVLNELGTNEFIHASDGTRGADLAKLNGLFLQAVTGAHVVDDTISIAIVRQILDLMGEHGCRRWNGDPWDGRVDRADVEIPGQQAQWCHAAAQLVPVLLDLYDRTGQNWLLDEAHLNFGRAIGSIGADWAGAESYIINPGTREWIQDENRPFAWWAAMMRCAFVWMERALIKQSVPVTKAA